MTWHTCHCWDERVIRRSGWHHLYTQRAIRKLGVCRTAIEEHYSQARDLPLASPWLVTWEELNFSHSLTTQRSSSSLFPPLSFSASLPFCLSPSLFLPLPLFNFYSSLFLSLPPFFLTCVSSAVYLSLYPLLCGAVPLWALHTILA